MFNFVKHKMISLIAVTLAFFLIVPIQAQDTEKDTKTEKGMVIIGIQDEDVPELFWRQFNPETGKLRPFSTIASVGDDLGKKLSTLFRFGGDKRNRRSNNGISYRITKLSPGTYVLEAANSSKYRVAFNGRVPIVQIESGKAAYIGDYSFRYVPDLGGQAIKVGRTSSEAEVFFCQIP